MRKNKRKEEKFKKRVAKLNQKHNGEERKSII
jgi:hypothetical protein